MFGAQKGAKPEDFDLLDHCVDHTVKLFCEGNEEKHQFIATEPGSGACGGIVGAFRALYPAQTKVVSGLEFIAELAGLEKKIQECDLVITGEGSYDDQTLQGKAVQGVIDLCKANKKRAIVICGRSTIKDSTDVFDFTSRYGQEESMGNAKECLKKLCE